MPSLSEADDAAADASPGPESEVSDTEGDSGTVAESSEPASKTDTEGSDAADLDTDLLSAFDEGMTEAKGGEASDDEPTTGDEPEADKAKAKDEAAQEEDADAAKAKADEPDPDALTDAERKSLSKAAAKKIDKLVGLKPAAKFAQEFTEHAAEAGLVTKGKDGSRDFAPLKNWLDTAAYVNRHTAEDRPLALADVAVSLADPTAKDGPSKAKALRALADRISPPETTAPKVQVVMMPEDLAALVSQEHLKPEEAERIAIDRLRAAGKLTAEEPPKKVPPAAEKKPAKAEPDRQHEARESKGKSEAAKALGEIKAKHKDTWSEAMQADLIKRIEARAVATEPEGYAQLVKDQAAIILANARARQPVKKAITTSPRPSSGGGSKAKIEGSDDWDSLIDETVKAR